MLEYIVLGPYKLSSVTCGDAFELIKKIPDKSVQLVLTDPPYNISRANNFKTMGREGFNWEWDQDFDITGWIADAARILEPGGSLLVCTDWKLLGTLSAAAESAGLLIKDPIVLEKSNPMPRNTKRRYVSDKEFAFWAVKPKGKWTFNLPMMIPQALAEDEDGEEIIVDLPPVPVHYARSTFRYAIPRKRVHPTKKPTGFFRDLIEIHSNIGDIVVDPFCGEGTTGVAAENTMRLSVQFELDAEMADYSQKALEEAEFLDDDN